MMWVSDRDAGIRDFLGELIVEAEILDPRELEARLALGQRPDALIIDGSQLLALAPRDRAIVLDLPRTLVCTGLPLASLPMNLVSGPGVAILAKPFCVEDLDTAVEWLTGATDEGPSAVRASLAEPEEPTDPATVPGPEEP